VTEVAGAAEGSTRVLVIGLAANFVAGLLVRHRWLAWAGSHDVLDHFVS
jgi:hypothetical protein